MTQVTHMTQMTRDTALIMMANLCYELFDYTRGHIKLMTNLCYELFDDTRDHIDLINDDKPLL